MVKIINLDSAEDNDLTEETNIQLDTETDPLDVETVVDVDYESQQEQTETEVNIDLEGEIPVEVEQTETTIDLTGTISPEKVEKLSELSDVDTTGVENDSLLLYNAVAETWYPSRYLGNHTFEAGHY